MFDLSLAETALIVLAALLLVDPKDLPAIVRTLSKWWREIRSATDEIRAGVNDLVKEAGGEDLDELTGDVEYIRDLEGNLQKTYDLSDFIDENPEKKSD